MSDGNFNRSLLPKNSFSSGLQTGEARMRQRAIDAFRLLLKNAFPLLSEVERETLEKEFRMCLQSHKK